MILTLGWLLGRGEPWRQAGALPEGLTVDCVAVDEDGLGVFGGYEEPRSEGANLEQRMSNRTASLWRFDDGRLERVYEGKGWIISVHTLGAEWFGVAATLKSSGAGSDYRLIRSLDEARHWEELGEIPALSVTQVLAADASRVYAFGAKTLMVTGDAGANWKPLAYPPAAKGRGFAASLALAQDGGVYAYGSGLMVMNPGAPAWETILPADYTVEAVSDPFVAAFLNDEVQLLRLGAGGALRIGELPADRLPVRIAAKGETIRVLTHPRNPEKLGFFSGGLNRVVYLSDDGGRSWKSRELASIQKADIAGLDAGVGVSVRNAIYSPQ